MAKKNETLVSVIALAVGAWLLGNRMKKTDGGIGATKYDYIDGKVLNVRYRNTSSMGNPSYWVTIETKDGEIVRGYTSPNASLGYEIENSYLKRDFHTYAITWGTKGAIFHYVK